MAPVPLSSPVRRQQLPSVPLAPIPLSPPVPVHLIRSARSSVPFIHSPFISAAPSVRPSVRPFFRPFVHPPFVHPFISCVLRSSVPPVEFSGWRPFRWRPFRRVPFTSSVPSVNPFRSSILSSFHPLRASVLPFFRPFIHPLFVLPSIPSSVPISVHRCRPLNSPSVAFIRSAHPFTSSAPSVRPLIRSAIQTFFRSFRYSVRSILPSVDRLFVQFIRSSVFIRSAVLWSFSSSVVRTP